MASGVLFQNPIVKPLSSNGTFMSGCTATFYLSATTTLTPIYADGALTTPLANPITADASGTFVAVYLDQSVLYRVQIKTSTGVLISDTDPVAIGVLLNPRTAAEISAGVTPTNFGYLPGDVRRYGAVSGVDCATIVTTATSANKLVTFPTGAWAMAATPTVPAGVILQAFPGATFSGAGAAALGLTTGGNVAYGQYVEPHTATAEYASQFFFRNADQTGGPVGNTLSALNVTTKVAAGVTNFEWNILGILNNFATGGQNNAGYFQGNKNSTGPTWGATIQAIEVNNVNNPTTGLVALEVDTNSNGTDANNSRIGIDVVCGRKLVAGVPSGPATVTAFGYRLQNSGDGANSVTTFGYSVWNCNVNFGFDTATASVSQGAFRMGYGQSMFYDINGVNKVVCNGANIGIDYQVANVAQVRLIYNGTTAGIGINGGGVMSQVIGPRINGYGAPTGGSRATLVPGTATAAQVCALLNQVIVDFQTHGALGT